MSRCLEDLKSLYGVHKRALDAVEDDDADGEEHDHEGEAVAQHPPAELALAEHAVFEGLDDARQGVETHYEAQLLIGDGAQRVYHRCGVHPQPHEVVQQQRHVAVLGGHAREEDAEAQRQSRQHQYQQWQQQHVPVGVYLSGDYPNLVNGIDNQEKTELDGETQQVADDRGDGHHHAWEIDLAEDASVGGEGRGGLGETVVEILPEADTA